MKLKQCLAVISVLFLVSCSSIDSGNGNDEIIDYDYNKETSGSQFDFDGNYTPPELTIDGLKDDKEWLEASDELVFGSQNQTKMTMYRGKTALFCFFDVKDEDIQTVGNNNGDDVTQGDSVEVYFDFNNDAAAKPTTDDIQINIGAHGKTRIFVGSNGSWGSWNGLLDCEIKLKGTLNDASDVDEGYSVELMIPYSQVGIDQNSVFGVSVGHVSRGKDSTSESLQYTWGGLVFEGSFVDPQSPKSYIVSLGNKFYSRGNMPLGLIDLSGIVYDENNKPISNATVKIGNTEVTTNSAGKYEFNNLDADLADSIEISKDGYKAYTEKIEKSRLKSDNNRPKIDYCLLSIASDKQTTITGVVKNPMLGVVEGASVEIGTNRVITNSKGEFSIQCKLDYDLKINISKLGFKENIKTLELLSLIKKNSYDLGDVSISSPAANVSFGGARGIPLVEAEIYRSLDGINFLFKSSQNIINGSHIEVFVDSGSSFHGRDNSDYRIDFTGEGKVSIVNFGNGSNNIASTSGIKNNAYLEGTTYYIAAMVPYSFLDANSTDIIGVSFGVWDEQLHDWDGWQYPSDGFESYVAPEYSDQYCRIGLDNGLYRALNNSVVVNKVYGKVIDGNGNIISTATINGLKVNADGSYSLYFESGKDVEINVSAVGYISKKIIVSKNDFNNGAYSLDIKIDKAVAVIKGTCNVEGARVYVEGNENIFTYVVNGEYSLEVPTTGNVFIILEAEEYEKVRFGIGVATLITSANSNIPCIKNITMTKR